MTLQDSYKKVKECIVGFSPKYLLQKVGNPPTEIFPIFGTGFIVREYGLIVTNDHVVEVFSKVPRPPNIDPDDSGVAALMFIQTPDAMKKVPLDVLGALRISKFTPKGAYYGPPRPDLAIVCVKARELPTVELERPEVFEEGVEVATAGYPMGTDALVAPGWLHQITPTLQRGVISAVLPFSCPWPHGFTINVMTQGGASGSPVFSVETGKVLGVLYGGLTEFSQTPDGFSYNLPTNISYVVPSQLILETLNAIENDPHFMIPKDLPTLNEIITTRVTETVYGTYQAHQVKEIKSVRDVNREIEKVSFKDSQLQREKENGGK